MTNFKHEIVEVAGGWRLSVWEPANATSDRLKPYLYRANYPVKTSKEAIALLEQIKAKNLGLEDNGNSNFAHGNGKVSSRAIV